MITVPATEFSKNFGRYRDMAQRETVAVTSHERITGYFVSSNDYEEFMRIKSMLPKTYATHELSEETIRAIATSKMDARHNHLNSLLDQLGMAFPNPEAGLVISYSYLWRYEHESGAEEGRKNRPCVVILAIEKQDGNTLVTVAPITHLKPSDKAMWLEIPPRVKQHLGLDYDKSWVIINEVNQFIWPGYDLRPIPNSKNKFTYGFLPPKLFEQIKSKILDLITKQHTDITMRD